jgi:ABC-2 type transport system ATP-binding protein
MLLGLVTPSHGRATIGGALYRDLDRPFATVGAALEAASFHPAHTGLQHLRIYCAAAGLPARRANEVLDLVGLGQVGKKKTKGYSMGMRQRLGLAGTLLGDPRVLILDEPANGLDPEGIRWLRGFFRHLAGEGRTVLVSSHQLAEVQEVADRAVILNRGRLVRAGTIGELSAGTAVTVVRGPALGPLQQALAGAGFGGTTEPDGALRVRTDQHAQVGHLAFVHGVELHELRLEEFDLERLFFSLTEGEHRGADLGGPPGYSQPPFQQGGGAR